MPECKAQQIGKSQWLVHGEIGALEALETGDYAGWLKNQPDGFFRIDYKNSTISIVCPGEKLTDLLTEISETHEVELFFPQSGRGYERFDAKSLRDLKFDAIVIRAKPA